MTPEELTKPTVPIACGESAPDVVV